MFLKSVFFVTVIIIVVVVVVVVIIIIIIIVVIVISVQANPDAAGFFFLTEFFVYDWGPTNSSSDITMLRYLNSTVARNECKKYIYLTHRIHQARTHDFTPRASYLQ